MSTTRYRRLMANLPSMAAIVNSFQSPDVQMQVYSQLIESLEGMDEPDPRSPIRATRKPGLSNGPLGYDLIEGDSIHAMALE